MTHTKAATDPGAERRWARLCAVVGVVFAALAVLIGTGAGGHGTTRVSTPAVISAQTSSQPRACRLSRSTAARYPAARR